MLSFKNLIQTVPTFISKRFTCDDYNYNNTITKFDYYIANILYTPCGNAVRHGRGEECQLELESSCLFNICCQQKFLGRKESLQARLLKQQLASKKGKLTKIKKKIIATSHLMTASSVMDSGQIHVRVPCSGGM